VASLRVAVIADTHLSEGRQHPRDLPGQAWQMIRACDLVLHAGDVLDSGTLDRLREAAPTYAVLGNNDLGLVGQLPETIAMELAGVQVAMVHDSGPRAGRARRLRCRFPEADVVVFGHSHIPCHEVGVGGQLLFNPGSPTTRRSQPHCTMGRLVLVDGEIAERRIIELA
jgi:putative phosphoesterase